MYFPSLSELHMYALRDMVTLACLYLSLLNPASWVKIDRSEIND